MANNPDEPKIVESELLRTGQADEAERIIPTYHREEIVGRTAEGRPRTIRVDRRGRIELAPASDIRAGHVEEKLDLIIGLLSDVRLGLSLFIGEDLENKG